MTPGEAIQHIKRHIEVHRIKEPQAIYITEALKMACDALEKRIAEIEPLRIVIENDNESIDEIIAALKTQKCVVMSDSESNVECIDIESIKVEAYKEFVTKAEGKATNLKDCTGTEVVFTVDDLYDLLEEMG